MPQSPELLTDPVPTGYCQCGCGGRTKIAPSTASKYGWVKGQPYRFLRGHATRKSGVDYLVDDATGCWVWQRGKTGKAGMGYGLMMVDGRQVSAHRHYYELNVGPIPRGLELDHLCRNTACCNPAHLEPVTHAENLRRGELAQRPACPAGHPYDEENTYRAPDGRKRCRTCARERKRRAAKF